MATYEKQTWANGDPDTPLSAARLNHIEQGIHDASEAVEGIEIPNPTPSGSDSLLSDGTDTTQRTWSAQQLADEFDRRIQAALQEETSGTE